jgi:Spy/CpxP family protein refolding chaperone
LKESGVRSVFILALIGIAALPTAARNAAGDAKTRPGIARQFGLKQLVSELNLTADQKAQIKTILANRKTQILQAVRDVVKARLDRINGVANASDELSAARQKAMSLRKSIREQIKPVLTSDQIAQLKPKIQNRQQLRAQRLQKILDRLNSKLGS